MDVFTNIARKKPFHGENRHENLPLDVKIHAGCGNIHAPNFTRQSGTCLKLLPEGRKAENNGTCIIAKKPRPKENPKPLEQSSAVVLGPA